jgi:hypothetical protein
VRIRPQARSSSVASALTAEARKCRRKFLRYFPGGFGDDTYLDWERDYKEMAHDRWERELGMSEMRRMLRAGEHGTLAARAVAIEGRTNLLFSFEKMALRDALRSPGGAQTFAEGLFAFLHGDSRCDPSERFDAWCECVAALPRRQTRVLTWPVVTVFGFLAQPDRHVFKPNVTRAAATAYGTEFRYVSRPAWPTYASLLAFARRVKRDQRDLMPRDMIDAQSFIWILGSDEYP